jgi:hypothetical protein
VPHCDACERFYNPNTLRPDGTCPTCGRLLAQPAEVEAATGGAPWHFKLLIAITVVYLSWRLVQGLVWLGHHL